MAFEVAEGFGELEEDEVDAVIEDGDQVHFLGFKRVEHMLGHTCQVAHQ